MTDLLRNVTIARAREEKPTMTQDESRFANVAALEQTIRDALPHPTQDPTRSFGKWTWSEPTQREIEAGKEALTALCALVRGEKRDDAS